MQAHGKTAGQKYNGKQNASPALNPPSILFVEGDPAMGVELIRRHPSIPPNV
jgi:hypothetical protein